MFEDSLLDYGGRMKTKKPMTVLLSFAIQAFILGVLVLIPLIYTEALPTRELMTFLMAPPPPPPPPPPPEKPPPPKPLLPELREPLKLVLTATPKLSPSEPAK